MDSNHEPGAYKTPALTIELCARIYICAGRGKTLGPCPVVPSEADTTGVTPELHARVFQKCDSTAPSVL